MQSTQAIARGLEERQRRGIYMFCTCVWTSSDNETDNRVYPSLQAWSRLWSAVQQVKEALLRQVQCSNPEVSSVSSTHSSYFLITLTAQPRACRSDCLSDQRLERCEQRPILALDVNTASAM